MAMVNAGTNSVRSPAPKRLQNTAKDIPTTLFSNGKTSADIVNGTGLHEWKPISICVTLDHDHSINLPHTPAVEEHKDVRPECNDWRMCTAVRIDQEGQ